MVVMQMMRQARSGAPVPRRAGNGVKGLLRPSWPVLALGAVTSVLLGAALIAAVFFLKSPMNATQGVVSIWVEASGERSSGSGFVVGEGGLVLTARHVVAPAIGRFSAQIAVFPSAQTSGVLRASIAWASADRDLALLRVPGLTAPPLAMNVSTPSLHEAVTAIGYPALGEAAARPPGGAAHPSLSPGDVSRLVVAGWQGPATAQLVVQHTAQLGSGSSGGPLINRCGEVVGLNYAASAAPKAPSDSDPGQRSFYALHASVLVRELAAHSVPVRTSFSPCAAAVADVQPSIATGFALVLLVVTAGFAGRQTLVQWIAVSRLGGAMPSGSGAAKMPGGRRDPTGGAPAGRKRHPGETPIQHAFHVRRGGPLRTLPIDYAAARSKAGVEIGRQPSAGGLLFKVHGISRRHARLNCERAGGTLVWFITDLNSRNSTRVNGAPVTPMRPVRLHPGDVIALGELEVEFGPKDAAGPVNPPPRQQAGWCLVGRDPDTGTAITVGLGDRPIPEAAPLVIGRDPAKCDVVIAHKTVSGNGHVGFFIKGAELGLVDLGSTNGTRLDGEIIRRKSVVPVRPGATIQIGAVKLVVYKAPA